MLNGFKPRNPAKSWRTDRCDCWRWCTAPSTSAAAIGWPPFRRPCNGPGTRWNCTRVDPSLYPLAAHQGRGPAVQLVWLGSSSTLRGLETIRPLLERLGRRWPGLHFKMICDRFLSLRHLPVLPVVWTSANEASELAGADIGISWMPDDTWSRGKCGLKVLQYMAAGLPVVANRVGVHSEMVRDGDNGFLAETPAQWEAVIGQLAQDPQLRQRMGMAGRQRVEADYAVAGAAARWL